MHHKLNHLFIPLLLISVSLAQFAEVSVTIDDRLIKENDRQAVRLLGDEIRRFYSTSLWDDDYADLGLPLHIQLIFQGTAPKAGETIFLAQLLVSNGSDQRYFDKTVQFPYAAGSSLMFNPGMFEPLPSLLTYYGYLILAGEADTYELNGGNKFYEISRELSLRGATSDYSKGWSDRSRTVDELSSNYGLRKVRLAYYYGRDLFASGELDQSLEQFKNLIDGLAEVFKRLGRDYYTGIFMTAHAQELTKMLSMLGQKQILADLIQLDHDNHEIYQAAYDDL